MTRIKCTYRTRETATLAATDINNIQRNKFGYFLSAELLVNGEWITWMPEYNESELFEEKDRLALNGKAITSFKNLYCPAIVVRNKVDDKEWFITVSRKGELERAFLQQNMVVGERVIYDDKEDRYVYYYNQEHKECIPDAKEPIWELVSKLYK